MSLQGRTIAIRGNIDSVEDLLIEGRIDGHIWNENHVVTVGAEGTLLATGRVDIMDEGRVIGRVLSKKLTLAEGGLFQGKAEPQHLEAALKVARHRRTEGAIGDTTRNAPLV
jgi:cytoskeletal protein CcmA (bactofilin family)